MSVCGYCGNVENNPGKYCTKCGNLIKQNSTFCIRCGTALKLEDRFCTRCGEPVMVENNETKHQNVSNEDVNIVIESKILDQQESQENKTYINRDFKVNLSESGKEQEKESDAEESDSDVSTENPNNYEEGDGFSNEICKKSVYNKIKIWVGIILAAIIIGGGIWGYNAYVKSSTEKERVEAFNREVNAWNEYRATDKGSAFLFMNGLLANKSSSEISDEIFDKYIKDAFGTEPDIEDKINGLITNYYLEYNTPISLMGGLSSDFCQKYSIWSEIGYPLEWNPIEEIENAGIFNFLSTEPIDKGKLVKIHYSLDPNRGSRDGGVINIKWENGGWTIDDFYKEGISFKDYLSIQINEASAPLLEEGNNLWEGELMEEGEAIPVSLLIKVEDEQIISAQFINDVDGKSVQLRPYRAEGYDLGLENSRRDITIRLNFTEDKLLIGKFCEFGEEIVECDIKFRKY